MRVASASCSSAPSTSVQAAQLTTASGRAACTAARTASGSAMSRSRRASPVTSCPALSAAAATARPSMPAAPVTRRRIRRGSVAARGPGAQDLRLGRPQREPELEARLRVLEALAEELAQLLDAIAHGLGMDAELGRDGLHLPGPVEPRPEGLGEPRTRAVGE